MSDATDRQDQSAMIGYPITGVSWQLPLATRSALFRIAGRARLAIVLAAFLGLVAGCSPAMVGPRVFYSIAAPTGAQPRVLVLAESTTRGDQPIAMTVLDPVSGRAFDTFPLSTRGAQPCGVPAAGATGDPVGYAAIDDRYIPFARWEAAANGRSEPYRVRLYFRSAQGVIWEAEVMPSYRGCPTG
ncbi:MAG: hypothetical protein ACRDIY_00660 [Chloroflexota bacterium]